MTKEEKLTKILDLLDTSNIEEATWIIRMAKYKKDIKLGTPFSMTSIMKNETADKQFYHSKLKESV